MKSIVIALSGPDGTGKTSCTKLLSIILRKKGIIVRHVWIKHVHTIAYILVKLLEVINNKHVVRSTSGTFVTHTIAGYSKLWPWIEVLGITPILIKTLLYTKLLRFFRKYNVVIADRYILDSIVHITISLLYAKREKSISKEHIEKFLEFLPFKILRSFLMKSTMLILLDGNVEILIKRKRDKSDPRNYLQLQRLLYKIVLNKLNIKPVMYIDTTNISLHTVCGNVLQHLM